MSVTTKEKSSPAHRLEKQEIVTNMTICNDNGVQNYKTTHFPVNFIGRMEYNKRGRCRCVGTISFADAWPDRGDAAYA